MKKEKLERQKRMNEKDKLLIEMFGKLAKQLSKEIDIRKYLCDIGVL